MNHFDVIIIGGGPTGSTVASYLADYGHKVLILEKEQFPREHVGESLIPASYNSLSRLGVLDDLAKISPRKPGVNFIANDGQAQSVWCFKNVVKDESYLSFHVKRSEFDKLLLDNSRKKGAHVLEQHMVKHVNLDREDGIVEVRATDAQGATKEFTAQFLVDASGLSTFLGSKFGVKKPVKDLDRVALFTHWSGAEYDKVLTEGAIKIVYLSGEEKKGWIWVIPISKDCLSIGVVLNNSYLKQEKLKYKDSADWMHDLYMSEIKGSEAVSKLLTKATDQHKVQIQGDYSYFCEKKYGDNYAMVGDAGAFLDPIFSSGIFVGMHSAQLVTDALHHKLSGKNNEQLDEAYVQINGAVKLIEKFIKLFYSPKNLNFSEMGNPENLLKFKESEGIYTIFHFLLAGDFFANYDKYSVFLDTMQEPNMLSKFKNLINHSKGDGEGASCGESFEDMYGKVTYEPAFDPKDFM